MRMYGFAELRQILDFILQSILRVWHDGLMNAGIIGAFVICVPILRKLITVFRKIF